MPLLGTVGQIESVAQVAVPAGQVLTGMRDIAVGAPLIFADGASIDLSVTCEDGRYSATTRSPDGAPQVHLRATCVVAPHFAPQPQVTPASALPQGAAVSAAQIYACFFHGPAFRVIASAQRSGDSVVATGALALPPWDGARATVAAPRVIELGLQTAGLLQLALDGAMMIPRHIARIERYAGTDLGSGTALFARAGRSAPGAPADIDVFDAAGAVVLRIIGYATALLPFAHDHAAADALAALLNHTPGVAR